MADGVPVDLQGDGLLWLINRVVFHPRGFALAFNGEAFTLHGDGCEAWSFDSEVEDGKFLAAERALAKAREVNDAP